MYDDEGVIAEAPLSDEVIDTLVEYLGSRKQVLAYVEDHLKQYAELAYRRIIADRLWL